MMRLSAAGIRSSFILCLTSNGNRRRYAGDPEPQTRLPLCIMTPCQRNRETENARLRSVLPFCTETFYPVRWATMLDPSDYLARAKIVNDHVKEQLNHKSIRYKRHEADVTVLEESLRAETVRFQKLFFMCMNTADFSMRGRNFSL